ncbi:hypothetical protein EGT74_02820 [Chitinophaga lutea]|uniref:Uncharacterized protein n=1 Tax=Chitinophaga lutea TaxID=2488634 RepID=A0A3N4PUQ7_9BACT|nr:hypothetical protein [Chitinophaga lutea]RPE12503.1 hypothetical protein EGT74_02820 [Chitinophaga lutea]
MKRHLLPILATFLGSGAFAQKTGITIQLALSDPASGQQATYTSNSLIYSMNRLYPDSIPSASRIGEMLVQTNVVLGNNPLALEWVCNPGRAMNITAEIKSSATGKLLRRLVFYGVSLYQGTQITSTYGEINDVLNISFHASPRTTASGVPLEVMLPQR